MKPNQQQSSQSTKKTDDTMMHAKTHNLPPDQVAAFLKQQKVTADQVAGMGLDFTTGQFQLSILAGSGLDHETERHVHIPSQSPDNLLRHVNAKKIRFFRCSTMKALTFPSLDKILQALAQVPDKTGQPAVDIYIPNSQVGEYVDCAVLPNTDNPVILNPKGRPGIANPCYIAEDGWQKLLCVFTDAQGRGISIAAYGIDEAQANPSTIGNQANWAKITDHPGRSIEFYGRPLKKGDHANLIVNLHDWYQRKLTLTNRVDTIVGEWGEEFKANRYAIGVVSGQNNIFASFVPGPQGADMWFEKPTQNTVAAAYLQ